MGEAPVVVASHGDQFMITAVTGLAAQTRPVNNIQPVYWLIKTWPNSDVTPADLVVRPDSTATSTILIVDDELMSRVMGLDARAAAF